MKKWATSNSWKRIQMSVEIYYITRAFKIGFYNTIINSVNPIIGNYIDGCRFIFNSYGLKNI